MTSRVMALRRARGDHSFTRHPGGIKPRKGIAMNTALQTHLADDIAHRYIALWNETDASRRLQLLTDGWTADARYVDPLANAAGAEGISALIAAVQSRFPGFRF